jgi:hypothetical protein
MIKPPRLAERLVRWSLPDCDCDRDAVLGDLQEEFAALSSADGHAAACRWYWAQTARSIGPNLIRRIANAHRQQQTGETEHDYFRRKGRVVGFWVVSVPVLVFAFTLATGIGDSARLVSMMVVSLFLRASLRNELPKDEPGDLVYRPSTRRWSCAVARAKLRGVFWIILAVGYTPWVLLPELSSLTSFSCLVVAAVAQQIVCVWPEWRRAKRPSR